MSRDIIKSVATGHSSTNSQRESLTNASLHEVRPGVLITTYDTATYPFAAAMCTALDVTDFSQVPSGANLDAQQAANLNSELRSRLKQLPRSAPIVTLYNRFLREFVHDLFGPRISYTQSPVLRVQVAHSGTISGLHRDAEYTGRWDYINGWLPMVDTPADRALRVETGYGTNEFEPIPLHYGQVLFFDAGMLQHGSPTNTSEHPRVSMDFRFAPTAASSLTEHITGHRPAHLVEATQLTFAQSSSQS